MGLKSKTNSGQRNLRASANFCALCGKPFLYADSGEQPKLARTVEHIIPRKRGGSEDMCNITVSHAVCNNRRGREIGMGPGFCIATGRQLSLAEMAAIMNAAEASRRKLAAQRRNAWATMLTAGTYPSRMTISRATYDNLIGRITAMES